MLGLRERRVTHARHLSSRRPDLRRRRRHDHRPRRAQPRRRRHRRLARRGCAPISPSPRHALDREEVFVVLEGAVTARFDDREETAEAGGALIVPAHEEFSLLAAGAPAEAVCVLPVGGRAVADGAAFTPALGRVSEVASPARPRGRGPDPRSLGLVLDRGRRPLDHRRLGDLERRRQLADDRGSARLRLRRRLSALLNLADRVPMRTLMAGSAALAALSTALLPALADGLAVALPLRFLTGFALAGVYPVGVKLDRLLVRRRPGPCDRPAARRR